MENQYSVPVAVIVFNRYVLAEKMLKCLEKIKPQKLFVISDGAREGIPGETEKVRKVRSLFEKIPWECEIYRNYADYNMGCDVRVPSGLDWVFGQVEQAVILEDDCIPDEQFFYYAKDMLEKYQEDSRVMMVAGSNMFPQYLIKESICFTSRVYCWGWATWSRAWKYYCDDGSEWKRIQENGVFAKTYSLRTRYYVKKELNYYFDRGKCPWDYLWWISCMGKGGLCIVPKVNLITNEGFGKDATHTQEKGNYSGKTFELELPLKYPDEVKRDRNFDKYDSGLNPPWKIVRAIRKIRKVMKKGQKR